MIDDILVYRQPFAFLVVCNASNRTNVVSQLESQRRCPGKLRRSHDRHGDDRRTGTAALETVQPLFDQPLGDVPYYSLMEGRLLGSLNTVISRTGYTGEDGFELIVGASAALQVWEACWNRASRMVWPFAGSGPGTHCGSRPPCLFTGTSFPIRSTLIRPGWPGRSSWIRAISWGARPQTIQGTSSAGEGRARARREKNRPTELCGATGKDESRRDHIGDIFADAAKERCDGVCRPQLAKDGHEPHGRRAGAWRAGASSSCHSTSVPERSAGRLTFTPSVLFTLQVKIDRIDIFRGFLIHGSQIAWISAVPRVGAN